MIKQNWLPALFLVALAAVYVIWFTDWFRPAHIHISHTVRELHFRRQPGDPQRTLIFGVDPRDIRLTEIKVVPLADFEKNPKTLPVWLLVSDSNSVPIRDFIYGQGIRGMRPLVAGMEPAPLDTNLVYRIMIKTGHATGVHDFKLGGTPVQSADAGNP